MVKHEHAIGARVLVEVDDERGSVWCPGVVTGHTTIGSAVRDGGWPTYRVRTDDGRTYDYASPECVRAAGPAHPHRYEIRDRGCVAYATARTRPDALRLQREARRVGACRSPIIVCVVSS